MAPQAELRPGDPRYLENLSRLKLGGVQGVFPTKLGENTLPRAGAPLLRAPAPCRSKVFRPGDSDPL